MSSARSPVRAPGTAMKDNTKYTVIYIILYIFLYIILYILPPASDRPAAENRNTEGTTPAWSVPGAVPAGIFYIKAR